MTSDRTMISVFKCPACNAALGTPERPTPDPLPPCPQCGWNPVKVRDRGGVGYLVPRAVVWSLFGAGTGFLTAHSPLLALFAVIGFGPVVLVPLAFTSRSGWFLLPLSYSVGFIATLLRFTDPTGAGVGWQFPVVAVLGSLLLAWLVGWLRHSR